MFLTEIGEDSVKAFLFDGLDLNEFEDLSW